MDIREDPLGSIAKEFFSCNHKQERACSLLENSKLRICKVLALIGESTHFSPEACDTTHLSRHAVQ
jgi:hypothetical protein